MTHQFCRTDLKRVWGLSRFTRDFTAVVCFSDTSVRNYFIISSMQEQTTGIFLQCTLFISIHLNADHRGYNFIRGTFAERRSHIELIQI